MPTAVLGVSHALTQDEGYRLPKGAVVITNNCAIHMDPLLPPEPRKFDPDRYQNATQSAADPGAS